MNSVGEIRLKGYIFSRPIDGQLIPQRVQNLMLREYARRHHGLLLFSAAEYAMENCFMILEAELAALHAVDGMVFYSMRQLPGNAAQRDRLYDRLLRAGKRLHFALESFSVGTAGEVERLEDMLIIDRLAQGDTLSRWLAPAAGA